MLNKLGKYSGLVILAAAMVFGSCQKTEIIDPPGIEVNMKADSFVFAVIGDYGLDSENEAAVATMVKSWDPDFIITTGDNNYQKGEEETLKENITKHYGDYIYNYDAPEDQRCNGLAFGDEINRFFPSPGNHDNYTMIGMGPYLNYFTLPGNEEYYKFSWGDADFFSLNSTRGSLDDQSEWLYQQIAESTQKFKIVYFHHSPYSTGRHGSDWRTQLAFHENDVDIVFTGHDHIYSRIEKKDEPGLYYVITGAGGKSLYACGASELDQDDFDIVCNDSDFGAVKGTCKGDSLVIEYYIVGQQSEPVDQFVIAGGPNDL